MELPTIGPWDETNLDGHIVREIGVMEHRCVSATAKNANLCHGPTVTRDDHGNDDGVKKRRKQAGVPRMCVLVW